MSAIGDRRPAGFTLIETLVVVAVAALISGIAFPRLSAVIDAQEFRTATATVHAGLQSARARAIRTGVPTAFRATDDGHGFVVGSDAVVALPAAVAMRLAGQAAIGFFPDGSSSGGALTLSGAAPAVRLAVAPSTGRISTVAR